MSQTKAVATIENPRKYPRSVVEHLRGLLHAGTPAHRDPQRVDFYEIQGDEETYYVHVSPVTGNVVLVAKWTPQPDGCSTAAGCLTA